MNDSYVKLSMTGDPAAFIGPDATALLRVMTLRAALRVYAKHKLRVNRAYSPAGMLAVASQITGRTYTRGQYLSAAADLTAWIETMKAALPVVVE